jgi:hypothetical protein
MVNVEPVMSAGDSVRDRAAAAAAASAASAAMLRARPRRLSESAFLDHRGRTHLDGEAERRSACRSLNGCGR